VLSLHRMACFCCYVCAVPIRPAQIQPQKAGSAGTTAADFGLLQVRGKQCVRARRVHLLGGVYVCVRARRVHLLGGVYACVRARRVHLLGGVYVCVRAPTYPLARARRPFLLGVRPLAGSGR